MMSWFQVLFSRSRLQSLRQSSFPATEEAVLQNTSCHFYGFLIRSKFLYAEAFSHILQLDQKGSCLGISYSVLGTAPDRTTIIFEIVYTNVKYLCWIFCCFRIFLKQMHLDTIKSHSSCEPGVFCFQPCQASCAIHAIMSSESHEYQSNDRAILQDQRNIY